MSLISIKNLAVSLNGAEVLTNVSFDVEAGDYIGIAGPNGAGKSTLIRTLLGLVQLSAGKIIILDQDSRRFDQWQKIGYLPQKLQSYNPLFPATVEEVILTGLNATKKFPKKFTTRDRKKVNEILKTLDIEKLSKRLVSSLSGGQQQRVFLGRALVSDPEILILDEPSTALDQSSRDNFFDLVGQLNKTKHITILLITHDVAHIGHYANKLLYIDRKVVFFGDFGDFCLSDDMNHAFGDETQHVICHQHHHA